MTPDQTAALRANNAARHSKNLHDLAWDRNLANQATEYAKHLASTMKMVHSGTKGEGENLYMTSPRLEPLKAAVEAWLSESKNYHGEKIGEGNFGSYGHYSEHHSTRNEVRVVGPALTSD